MSKFLNDDENDDAKAIAIPRFYLKNSQAKKKNNNKNVVSYLSISMEDSCFHHLQNNNVPPHHIPSFLVYTVCHCTEKILDGRCALLKGRT